MKTATQTYSLTVAGIKRELPLFEVGPNVKIALFNMLGDTEVVVTAAAALAKKIPAGVEVLVTPEVKSVPLAQELSRVTGLPYVVVRKNKKPYMMGAMSAEVMSITTGQPQFLWLDGRDIAKVAGHNVAFIDDVLSTGSTFRCLSTLMAQAGANVVAKVVVFTEGDKMKNQDVTSLGHLPLFNSNGEEK